MNIHFHGHLLNRYPTEAYDRKQRLMLDVNRLDIVPNQVWGLW